MKSLKEYSKKTIVIILSFLIFFQILNSKTVRECINQFSSAGEIYISPAERADTREQFVTIMFNKMKESKTWLNFNAPHISWFNIDTWKDLGDSKYISNKFMPYVEKLIVEPGSEVAFLGDLHGDLVSLIDYLEVLKIEKYLDKDYKICKDKFYVICLGDYIDRGDFSLEVFYLVIKFFDENPGKVFLIRGNHENLDLMIEGRRKLHSFYPIFDCLVDAVYLGCKDSSGKTNFLQCCHGGIEVGFDPKPFLEHDDVKFQKIVSLKRIDNLEEMGLDLSKIGLVKPVCLRNYESGSFMSPSLMSYGFACNFFADCESFNMDYDNGSSIILGRQAVDEYLKFASSDNNVLCGVIRGHQHNNTYMNFLDLLEENVGCVKIWDGLVYTLISTFFSNYSDYIKYEFYGSFVILKTVQEKQGWKLTHYFSRGSDKLEFKKQSFPYF